MRGEDGYSIDNCHGVVLSGKKTVSPRNHAITKELSNLTSIVFIENKANSTRLKLKQQRIAS